MPKGVYLRSENTLEGLRERAKNFQGRGITNPNWRGGKSSHPMYHIYNDMKGRCLRATHPRYSDYGGRGIRVHKAWLDDFWQFVEDVGVRPEGKTSGGVAYWQLDRIDNDGNYEPGNVRWATPAQQRANSRQRRQGVEPLG